jgi:ankyrin repeat protein
VPLSRLPNDSNLEQLANQAEVLRDFVRAGVPEAIEMVREFHPRPGELGEFSRAQARLVTARRYGFASWAKLRRYIEVVTRYARSPHREAVGGPLTSAEERADEFLRLACLTHGDDDPQRWRQAAELLTAHPELAAASIYTAAAAGDVSAARRWLTDDPRRARLEGGPHRWEPLLYLAYSALDGVGGGGDHVEVARLLLDAGADPNAGYLWEGLPSPYTALTGAFDSRRTSLDLARLLLDRGAEANDSQALYELSSAEDDPEPLQLLFAHGLGTGTGGVWHARLAPAHPAPAQLVEDELVKAGAAGWPRRARLILDHGVDVNGLGTSHPIFGGYTAYELAVLSGSTDVVNVLEAAGAAAVPADPVLEFLGACMRADRTAIERLRRQDPAVVGQAIARRPHQISAAADKDRFDAVVLMADLGFDVNAADRYPHQQTALHGAAFNGNLAMVEFLMARGADPSVKDCSFHSTPLGWAEHNHHIRVVEYLRKADQ